MSDNDTAAIAIFLIFGGPLAAWIIWRVFAHQERIEMIRRGMIPPPEAHWGRHWRNYGAWPPPPGQMPPSGTQPQPGQYVPPPAPPPAYEYYAQSQLRKGITLTMIGFALLIGLSFIGPLSGIFFFGPWMLGGLIPMFVGVAQIINAILNGARIPGAWGAWSQPQWGPPPGSTFGQGPGQPQTGVPPRDPPPAGPYGWRPDSTPEIPKPAPPPDRR
jgi:hypothetical protein